MQYWHFGFMWTCRTQNDGTHYQMDFGALANKAKREREKEKTPSEQKKQKAIDIFPFSVPNWQIFVLDARFFILCAFSI